VSSKTYDIGNKIQKSGSTGECCEDFTDKNGKKNDDDVLTVKLNTIAK